MAVRGAIANGNWSSPSTWLAGIIPSAADTVVANSYTVVIDQDITITNLSNRLTYPTQVLPYLTGYTTDLGTVSASSEYYPAWRAFDSDGNTYWSPNNESTFWIEFEFVDPIILVSYYHQYIGPLTSNFTLEQFQAWNGSSWDILTSKSGAMTYNGYTGTSSNTTAYTRYRIYFETISPRSDYSFRSIRFYELGANVTTLSGGKFTINDGYSINCSGEFLPYSYDVLLTYSGSSSISIAVGKITPPTSVDNVPTFLHAGTGTVNLTGTLEGNGRSANSCVRVDSGILNFTGDLISNPNSTQSSYILRSDTNNPCEINITGNIYQEAISGNAYIVYIGGSLCNLTFVGSVIGGRSNGFYFAGSSSNLTIIGPIQGALPKNSTDITLEKAPVICFLKGFSFTGPVISSPSGLNPLDVSYAFLIPTVNSYYQFLDNSTDGLTYPEATPGYYSFVSPGSSLDLPNQSDVRKDIVYGPYTGTMIVPAKNTVSAGTQVDDGYGEAILSVGDIWGVPTNSPSLNLSGSIGKRLKNAATVQSTGEQIQNLSNDE